MAEHLVAPLDRRQLPVAVGGHPEAKVWAPWVQSLVLAPRVLAPQVEEEDREPMALALQVF